MPKKSFSPLLPWVTCILASFFYVYDYFIQAAPSILTHQLTTAFHLSPSELGILGSSFFYPYALMQIPAAILIYRYGARLCLSVAVCISGLGVFTFGLATHIWVAIIARAMVGFGSAFAFIGALSLIACWFSHKRFALLVGLLATAGCLGGMVGEGPLLALVNRFQWRPTLMAHILLIPPLTVNSLGVRWSLRSAKEKACMPQYIPRPINDRSIKPKGRAGADTNSRLEIRPMAMPT